ncbi:uncharacterized protein LOC107860682 isoform X3 [Capsicum annuum]|uniref:uncharacterized protein LOC107860682 isoform X3 n=1 Tax=Capsicum annuum TaxID=4072 RepID=UPI0007BEDD42|nr:uncharacterized protein LOC107860682 isoform X3 [Capsicum annuum]
MAMVSNTNPFLKSQMHQIYCRKKEKEKSQNPQPYKVIEISPPPKNLGIRCLPSDCNLRKAHKHNRGRKQRKHYIVVESNETCSVESV